MMERADVVITMTAKIAVVSGTIKNDCKREAIGLKTYLWKADVSGTGYGCDVCRL